MPKTIKITKRPNPAVAQSERAARASEDMADIANSMPGMSSLATRIASGRRRTADKIRKERPYLIATEEE